MLQNPCKTLGFKKNMVYKIPPGGGGKPYPTSGLVLRQCFLWVSIAVRVKIKQLRDKIRKASPCIHNTYPDMDRNNR